MTHNAQTTELELVEPRMVSVRFVGLFDQETASRIMDQMEDLIAGEPFFMFEVVIPQLEGATPEARRIAAERFRRLPKRAVAVVGGNFKQRLLAKLVIRALMWLDPGNTQAKNFPDHETARAWMREFAAQQDEPA